MMPGMSGVDFCAKLREGVPRSVSLLDLQFLALENTRQLYCRIVWHVLLQQSCGIVLEVLIGMLAALLFKEIC